MRAKVEIAFRRKVKAAWLEQGMALAAQEVNWKEAKPALAEAVAAENPGAETIRKVLEHIRRIWFEPPDDSNALRSHALRLFETDGSREARLLLNWGMTMAAYPFVGSVGEALGRLLRLQKEAHRADVQRRLREQHGDRDFVDRITRYDVSSFLDWGVITETKKGGVYIRNKQTQPKNAEQLAWLAEAVLISRDKTQMAFSELRHHPILFPVVIESWNAPALRSNPRLKVVRQNLNDDVVFRETVTSREATPRLCFPLNSRYADFPERAIAGTVFGLQMPVAKLDDLVQAKLWAFQDLARRASKRAKDRADLIRLCETYAEVVALIPVGLIPEVDEMR